MNERIRLVREAEGLSRAAFGQRLGLSGDVINNLERGRVDIKDHIVKLICSEYNVQESWLRTGEGEMYCKNELFSLDQFAKERGATQLELEVVKAYFDLDPNIRRTVVEHFKKRLVAFSADPDEAEAEQLKQEYLREKKAEAESSASAWPDGEEGTA